MFEECESTPSDNKNATLKQLTQNFDDEDDDDDNRCSVIEVAIPVPQASFEILVDKTMQENETNNRTIK